MKQLVERKTENSASRIRSLLRLRHEAEAEIARILGDEKKTRGTEGWLRWCEKEFGWGQAAAYNHLNPELMEKARQRAITYRMESNGDDNPAPWNIISALSGLRKTLDREWEQWPSDAKPALIKALREYLEELESQC